MAAPETLGDLHAAARRRLRQAGIDGADLDARLLVEHFSSTSRTDAISRPDLPVAPDAVRVVESALARRADGEPVHRIIGYREFYGLRLALSKDTLEPRPDTEVLVDALLPHVRETAAREGVCRILDLGTGTGAIALALLAEVDDAEATGVDIAPGALETARANAESLGLGKRFTPLQSDWFEKISGRYHAIASNPPYISSNELSTLQGEVRNFDPVRALDGGEDGLDAYRRIAAGSAQYLEAGGIVAVEIGIAQTDQVEHIFAASGYRLLESRCDLGGIEWVLLFVM